MKRITPDNIDELYEIVNDKIDRYFSFDINPTSIKKYFTTAGGMDRFIKRSKLSEYKNVEKIVKDVIDDRVAMNGDGISTFESFRMESTDNIKDTIFANLDRKNFTKFLADHYKTSISYINLVEKKYNIFNIKSLDLNVDTLIINENYKNIIRKNLQDYIYEYLREEVIDIPELGIQYELDNSIVSNISLSDKDIQNIISYLFREDDFQFKGVFGDYLIWER